MNAEQSKRIYAALGLAGQAGCLTVGLAVGALLVGLWLDQRLGTHRTWALICVIGSVPVTLVFTLWITQRMIGRVVPQDQGAAKRDTATAEAVHPPEPESDDSQ